MCTSVNVLHSPPYKSVVLRPGGVRIGLVICPVGVTGLLLERPYTRSLFPWLPAVKECIMRLLGVKGLLGVHAPLGVWARLLGLLGDVRPMTRLVGLVLWSGRPAVFVERLLGDCGLDVCPSTGRVLVVWKRGVKSELLWGLFGLRFSFPCSASLAKSFSTSEEIKTIKAKNHHLGNNNSYGL